MTPEQRRRIDAARMTMMSDIKARTGARSAGANSTKALELGSTRNARRATAAAWPQQPAANSTAQNVRPVQRDLSHIPKQHPESARGKAMQKLLCLLKISAPPTTHPAAQLFEMQLDTMEKQILQSRKSRQRRRGKRTQCRQETAAHQQCDY